MKRLKPNTFEVPKNEPVAIVVTPISVGEHVIVVVDGVEIDGKRVGDDLVYPVPTNKPKGSTIFVSMSLQFMGDEKAKGARYEIAVTGGGVRFDIVTARRADPPRFVERKRNLKFEVV